AGELGEVVGGVQHIERLLPVLLEDEVVPVRDDIVDRATGHAKRDAAIHAARTLNARFLIAERMHELVPVLDAVFLRLGGLGQSLILEKSRYFAHCSLVGCRSKRITSLRTFPCL